MQNETYFKTVELLLLILLVKCMDGHVVLIDGRVRERPVAKIHAILTRRCRKSGRQVGGFDVVECNAVGCREVTIDRYAHDGSAVLAHVNQKAYYVTYGPFAAVIR